MLLYFNSFCSAFLSVAFLDAEEPAPMQCSVVVRSLNEADRLRLALMALGRQREPCEVVVVNDGSTDHTRAVLSDFAGTLNLKIIHHETPQGRAAAANAGAALAEGDILFFLDGDVLLAPNAVADHMAVHRLSGDTMVRGSQYHLRGTRFLLDPAAGTPMPGQEGRVARLTAGELDKIKITPEQIGTDFTLISRRASPSIYPGIGPARLYELEVDALVNYPDYPEPWVAASGHNFSVPRRTFIEAGGVDPALDQNDHREMALRLARAGLKIRFAPNAASYHLTHRSGWRDPLQETGWERVFYRRHPLLIVKLLSVFWAGINEPCPVPEEARIRNLPELAEAATGARHIDYDRVRRMIPNLQDLSIAA